MRIRWIAIVAALAGGALVACGAGNGVAPNGGNGNGGGNGSTNGGGGGNSGGNGGGDMALDPQLDLYQSGTRIKMKVLTTPDGAKSFQGWYDSQLGIDCQFLVASDGQTRCVPLGSAYAQSFFSDTGCATPLAFSTCAGASAPAYAFTTTTAASASCAPTYRIFAVTGVYTGTVYSGTPASCSMVSGGILASYTFYTLGGEVAPSTFVAGSVAVQ